jgi:hypothetical protein
MVTPCGYVMHKATLLLMSRFRNEYRIPFRQTPCRLTQIYASTSPSPKSTGPRHNRLDTPTLQVDRQSSIISTSPPVSQGYMLAQSHPSPDIQEPRLLLARNNSCGHKLMSVAFAFGLGTTHPCAIAVHMEPFSTSALKDLT